MKQLILIITSLLVIMPEMAAAGEFKMSSFQSSEIKPSSFSQSSSARSSALKPISQPQKPALSSPSSFKAPSVSSQQGTKFSLAPKGPTSACSKQQNNTNLTMLTSDLKGRLSGAADQVRRATARSK